METSCQRKTKSRGPCRPAGAFGAGFPRSSLFPQGLRAVSGAPLPDHRGGGFHNAAVTTWARLEYIIKSGVNLCFLRGAIIRTVIVLASLLLSGATLADSVRHLSVPERFWGTWAPSIDLCRDDKSVFVVSAKGYVTSQANCTIQWLTETAGAEGPIYSAHMRCSNP